MEYKVHLWLWDKKSKAVSERHTVFIGDKIKDKIAYCKKVANELWVKYPSSQFDKEVLIREDGKVILRKDNINREAHIQAYINRIHQEKKRWRRR